MKIAKRIVTFLIIILLLYLTNSTLKNPYGDDLVSSDTYVYSKGNAPEAVRSEIIQQLDQFQKGYELRDVSIVESFMQRLFSKDNITVLGTMPKEIYTGYDEATDLVDSDWKYWGDCRFLIDKANISTNGDVAWFSTIGFVKFDLSRFLVLPLRLSGVLVKEDNVWKFQQLQFQFDLDHAHTLYTLILLYLLLTIYTLSLSVLMIRKFVQMKKRRNA